MYSIYIKNWLSQISATVPIFSHSPFSKSKERVQNSHFFQNLLAAVPTHFPCSITLAGRWSVHVLTGKGLPIRIYTFPWFSSLSSRSKPRVFVYKMHFRWGMRTREPKNNMAEFRSSHRNLHQEITNHGGYKDIRRLWFI